MRSFLVLLLISSIQCFFPLSPSEAHGNPDVTFIGPPLATSEVSQMITTTTTTTPSPAISTPSFIHTTTHAVLVGTPYSRPTRPVTASSIPTNSNDGDGGGSPFSVPFIFPQQNSSKDASKAIVVGISIAVLLCAVPVILGSIYYRCKWLRKDLRKNDEERIEGSGRSDSVKATRTPAMQQLEDNQDDSRQTTQEEHSPPYLPREPERTLSTDRNHFVQFWRREHDVPLHEMEMEPPQGPHFTTASGQVRTNTITSESGWTDCSVTEPDSVHVSYTSSEPMPTNPFVTPHNDHRAQHDRFKGYVEKQVRRLNSRPSNLNLRPFSPYSTIEPEVVSPKETSKVLHFKRAVYTHAV